MAPTFYIERPLSTPHTTSRAVIEAQPQYRSPSGYYNWKTHLSMLYAYWVGGSNALLRGGQTISSNYNLGTVARGAFTAKAPAIYVSRELVAALLNTDVPPIPEDLPVVLPVVQFMLPTGSFPTEVHGHSIYSLVVERLEVGAVLNRPTDQGNVLVRLGGFSTEREGYHSWLGNKAGGYGITSYDEQSSLDTLRPNDEVAYVIEKMRGLAVNLMLLLTYKRDLLSTDPHGSGKPIGFQTQREQRNILLPTTWLGRDFRAKKTGTPSGSGGSHASPQAHWRRGH